MLSLFLCGIWVCLFVFIPALCLATTILPSNDDTLKINSVLAKGGQAQLVNAEKPYVIDDTLVFAAGASLIGKRGTVIDIQSKKMVFFVPSTAHDVTIKNITFNGAQLSGIKPMSVCSAPHFSWIGGGTSYGGPIFLTNNCNDAYIADVKIEFSSAGGIAILGAAGDKVLNSEFDNNAGFGIFATDGATHFTFSGNRSKANEIEGIAIGYSAHDGLIRDNSISGAGDNCISISGRRTIVSNNRVSKCLGAGIAIFGDDNIARHNVVLDNVQVINPKAPPIKIWNGSFKQVYESPGYATRGGVGIAIAGAAGGYGQNNLVERNHIIDDQINPTQNGIKISTGTPLWAPGFVKKGMYMFANGSTYFVTSDGYSLKPPSGTTIFHDGSVLWKWCSRPLLQTREASANIVLNNVIRGFPTYKIKDFTSQSSNKIH